MTPYTAFFTNIYTRAPEAPDPAVLSAVRDTCIDFCKQTNVWQIDLDPIDIVGGEPSYDLFTPPQTNVTQVLGLTFERRDLHPTSETVLRMRERNWTEICGEPRNFMRRPGDDLVRLFPKPHCNKPGALNGTISVQPTRASTFVIDDVYQRYLEPIVNGALASLYMHVGTAYSNPHMAGALTQIYQDAVNQARKDIKLAYNPAPAHVPRPKSH